jgi:hypothetical protein
VIEPGARALVQATTSGRVAVIGTVGTVSSGAYARAVDAMGANVELTVAACPGFVEFVERGETEGEQVTILAERLLAPVRVADVDTLLLGCTHYPYLARVIADVMGPDVVLVSSADETAFAARTTLDELGLMRQGGRDQPAIHRFLSSGDVAWFAELGRRLVPGPLVWSQLAAELIPGAASGEQVVGGLDRVAPGSEPVLIEHLDALDALLVLRPSGVHRVDPRQLRTRKIETPLDPLTPLHEAAELPEGERIAGPEAAQRLRVQGGALAAAQLFGIAEATQELATAYAKGREQFGRSICSFQAVKHLLADMFVRQELARAAAYAAGATLDHPEVGDPARAVQMHATTQILSLGASIALARHWSADIGADCVDIYGNGRRYPDSLYKLGVVYTY